MKARNLSLAETVITAGATHVVRVVHTDLTGTAALTKTQQLLPETSGSTLPIGTMYEVVGIRVSTAFVGPSVSSLTLQVGDGGDTDRVFTAAMASLLTAAYYPATNLTTAPGQFTAADTIDGLFTAVGANLSVLTAGVVDIYLAIVDPANLPSFDA
jgi:hypothetical protein